MFQVLVKISNPSDPDRFFEEQFWVDTGALYSLQNIGIEPLRSRDLILADSRRDRRLLGEAAFTVFELEETLTCPVIFAPKNSLYLLSATALKLWRRSRYDSKKTKADFRHHRRFSRIKNIAENRVSIASRNLQILCSFSRTLRSALCSMLYALCALPSTPIHSYLNASTGLAVAALIA